MSNYELIIKRLSIAGIAVFVVFLCLYISGARINTSRSIPLGLYWATNAPVTKNSYVIFCPPAESIFIEAKKRGYLTTGFCEGELGYMMKKVLAAKNDTVIFSVEGVLVNGELLPSSSRLASDRFGREMPAPATDIKTLNENELLVMADNNSKSFDSRYFGVVNINQIKSVIKPIYTW